MLDLLTLSLGGLCLLIILAAAYVRSANKYNFWEKQGIPYIKPFPILGNLGQAFLKSTPVHEFDLENYKKFGSVYGGFEGTKPYLFISDPHIIKEIMIREFSSFSSKRSGLDLGDDTLNGMLPMLNGETWKRVRNLITPTFSSGKLKQMVKLIDDCSLTSVNFLEKKTNQESVEMKKVLGALSMDLIAAVAFGTKIDCNNDPNNPFITNAKNIFAGNINFKVFLILFVPKLARALNYSFVDKEVVNFFKSVVAKLIKERKNSKQENARMDFLQLMIDAEKLDKRNESQTSADKSIKKGMSESEIISQCISFFFAGYDTTTSVLCLIIYCLSINPEIQETLAIEIATALEDTNGELDYEVIKNLPYLNAVVSETLRLFPPGTRIEREATVDYEIKSPPVFIPKGTQVGFPVFAIHRDSKYYPNPETFDPERFLGENKDSINNDVYLPFGAGPRNCIGMRFALLEVKFCVTRLVSRLRFSVSKDTVIPIKFLANQGLLRPQSVSVKVDTRT